MGTTFLLTTEARTDLATNKQAARRGAELLSRHHEIVVESPLSTLADLDADCPAVSMPAASELECYPDASSMEAVAMAAGVLADDGWAITVVVSGVDMGEAHRVLRGRPVTLQPWWLDNSGNLCFGGPEVP